MATAPRSSEPRARSEQRLVQNLINVQRAAQAISSVLDLDILIERIVEEVTSMFDCVEALVWLRDDGADEMVLAGVRGCTSSSKGQRLAIGKQGMVGHVAATARTRYAPDVSVDPHYLPCEPGIRSEVDIPLIHAGRVIGVLSASHHELDAFSPEQLQLLEGMAGHIAVAVENARRFREERQERERMQKDAQEARFIQQALFPKTCPRIPGFRVEGKSVPAGAVGGDWYDFLPLGGGKWGIVLADVSGKGMAAALLMSATRGILRSLAETSGGPAEVLEKLNRALLADIPSGRFVTMVYAVLDPAARVLTFANAGHPWPILADGAGPCFLQTQSGLPLGLAATSFSEFRVEFTVGSHLLLYSDGITEAMRADEEEFGAERLRARLGRECTPEELIAEAAAFAGSGGLTDDATVILIHAEEPSAPPVVRHPL